MKSVIVLACSIVELSQNHTIILHTMKKRCQNVAPLRGSIKGENMVHV